jgi:hypothetical protein
MKPRALAVLALAVLLLAIPAAAQAKGATSATISGGGPGGLPGGPITLRGDGEPGSGTDLANLAEAAGLFALAFEAGPGVVLPEAPTGRLGPRYTITWSMPDPDGGPNDKVREHLYPYAAGGPVTFMPADQPIMETTTTAGWFKAPDTLRQQLIALGLPNRPPLAPPASPKPTATPQPSPAPATPPAAWPRVAAVLAALILLAAVAALPLRRHATSGTPAG